jgi:hypothetical protein
MLKEELKLFLIFKNIKREATLPNTFYEDSITLIPKLEDTTKIEKYITIFLMKTDLKEKRTSTKYQQIKSKST